MYLVRYCKHFIMLCLLMQALELDASNEKALFRRGEALFGMKEFDKARDDFQQVIQLYPANKAAKSQVRQKNISDWSLLKDQSEFILFYYIVSFVLLLYLLYLKVWLCDRSSILSCQVVLCQKRIKEQHEKDKRIYANMFTKFAERDSKVKDCVFYNSQQREERACFSKRLYWRK